MNVLSATAAQLATGLHHGELSAADILDQFLVRIRQLDPHLGAFLHVAEESARRQADQIDQRRRQGHPLGPLAGVPVAVKDNICTFDQPTTCGSRMLENFRPPYDATVVCRLRSADAVIVGKTNLDEFAMGSTTENSALGTTRNPWDLQRVPGGSSGGSAACVAAGLTPLALGSDTGGSIRQPASFCGVVGLKPTYGRVSRYGLVAFASSLDQIGPFARTAQDAAQLLQVIAGHDPADSTSAPDSKGDGLSPPPPGSLDGLRIGIVPEQLDQGLDDQVRQCVLQAVDLLRSHGATVQSVDLPHSRYAIATYYVVASCEASSNLARYDGVHYGYRTDERAMEEQLDAERRELERQGDAAAVESLDSSLVRLYRQTRSEGFGQEVKRRIMLGTYALSSGYYDAYYLKALKVRRLIRQDYDRAFEQVDVLVGPATPHPAYRIGEKCSDPLAMYLGDLFTVGANLAGIPAMCLPCGFTSDGLPVGLQIQTAAFGERRLLQLATDYQNATSWHQQRPQPV